MKLVICPKCKKYREVKNRVVLAICHGCQEEMLPYQSLGYDKEELEDE